MVTINLNNHPYSYNHRTKTFSVSELGIRFATVYDVLNPKTGGTRRFDFSHSTGPEFDPNTKWIYKSVGGLVLQICNDAEITKLSAANYLKAKLQK